MAPTTLECTPPGCTLGNDGAKYKTPEMEMEFAMQLLVMHQANNHQQGAVMAGAGVKKTNAEKVNRPTIKMGSSEDDFNFFQCLFES